MFLLVPAHPGCPGQRAVKQLLLLCVVVVRVTLLALWLVSAFLDTKWCRYSCLILTPRPHAFHKVCLQHKKARHVLHSKTLRLVLELGLWLGLRAVICYVNIADCMVPMVFLRFMVNE